MSKDKTDVRKADIQLNMTPMIDVVFNLLIFFMVVTDLTQREMEELQLPSAEKGDEIVRGVQRVVLNVVKAPGWAETGDVAIRVRGRSYSLALLRERLYVEAEALREEPGGPSELVAHIRCDKDIRWREVQWVMQVCANEAVRIYQIEFGVEGLDKD